MRNLLQIEKCLNDIYNISDPKNESLTEEEKLKRIWVVSIEALEVFEGLRKDIKKFSEKLY
jgi:hypothetical protein